MQLPKPRVCIGTKKATPVHNLLYQSQGKVNLKKKTAMTSVFFWKFEGVIHYHFVGSLRRFQGLFWKTATYARFRDAISRSVEQDRSSYTFNVFRKNLQKWMPLNFYRNHPVVLISFNFSFNEIINDWT